MDGPRRTLVRQWDTHRLIPARFADTPAAALAGIARSAEQRGDLEALAEATNTLSHAARGRSPAIGPEELVAGVPYAHVVNATFVHAHPLGGRFNGAQRGAWYCGFARETALAEIVFHKTAEFAEIGRFDQTVDYVDFLADFSAELHDLRMGRRWRACLDPASYVASQSLAEALLLDGALGVVYPSVRHAGGTCIACFRPALVGNVRRDRRLRIRWLGAPDRVEVRSA